MESAEQVAVIGGGGGTTRGTHGEGWKYSDFQWRETKVNLRSGKIGLES